jgi:hypothetical protein
MMSSGLLNALSAQTRHCRRMRRRAMSSDTQDFVIQDEKKDEKKGGKGPDSNAAQGHEAQASGDKGVGEGEPDFQLPEINFSTFIFSLNTSALVHMGMLEDPSTMKKDKNLSMAKQTIDILSMMEEKTRGNLSANEADMIKNILYDLRIMYVKSAG